MTNATHPPGCCPGCCPDCGGTDLTLARDATTYSKPTYTPGVGWDTDYSHQESIEMDNSAPLEARPVRLFCADCGCYMPVPEELL
jgi:hypothetical protein